MDVRQTHADLYGQLKADAAARPATAARGSVPAPPTSPATTCCGRRSFRLVPNNALNVRLVSLFLADRAGRDLPDVVEIRQTPSADTSGRPPTRSGSCP